MERGDGMDMRTPRGGRRGQSLARLVRCAPCRDFSRTQCETRWPQRTSYIKGLGYCTRDCDYDFSCLREPREQYALRLGAASRPKRRVSVQAGQFVP